ncbi:hypothetical protein Tco_0313448 [Tanacetum coccineum]
MSTLKFADTHNMVAFLSKPTECDGFKQIVDFLNAHPIRYALTINPTIYISCIEQFWSTVKAKTIDREAQLHALVDGKKIIITESSFRSDLQLADEEGEGSALPTDPHHTPIFIQPSTQPQKTQQPRKPKRNHTQVSQSSDHIENVVDKVVHKELGDILVRVATTASSLEAEQDSGNINKTQSKATPNESSSQGPNLGGGPRCQETMGDTIAHTRFESVSKHSNNSLLTRGNTLRSDEDRLKLDELMTLCTTIQNKGRIDAIDADEEITLVSVHDEMDVDEEVVEVINTVKLIIDVAQDSVAGDIVSVASAATTVSVATITTATIKIVDDFTLAQALRQMKSTKPKKKGVVIQELGESTTTLSSQLSSQQSHDKGKGILIEPVMPMKKKNQISLDEETALNLQAKFDEEERLAREKAEKEEEANIALIKT